MERTTLRERQRQAREEAILDAAHELLQEQGYAAMSMDELAARLGASKATLYQHFPSKEDLAIRVIIRMMRRSEEQIAADPSLPALTRLERWLQTGLEQRTGLTGPRISLLPQHVAQHPLYQDQRRRMVETLSALVEQAKAEGGLAAHLATPVAVRLLMNAFSIDFDDLVQSSGLSTGQVVSSVVEMIFNGLRKPTFPIHPEETTP